MNNKLQAVEDKIRELVPRLQELSFGCYFLSMDGAKIRVENRGIEFCHKTNQNYVTKYPSGIEFYVREVIGHPITLEDVLEAVSLSSRNGLAVRYDGQFWNVKTGNYINGIKWKMGKPISEQSPELIELLHKLLITN